MPLEDEVARPQHLRGGLGGRLADRLGLAELPWEVAGAGRLGRAQSSAGQGGVAVREPGGSGLEALAAPASNRKHKIYGGLSGLCQFEYTVRNSQMKEGCVQSTVDRQIM